MVEGISLVVSLALKVLLFIEQYATVSLESQTGFLLLHVENVIIHNLNPRTAGHAAAGKESSTLKYRDI